MLILRFSALGVPVPLPAGDTSSVISAGSPSDLNDGTGSELEPIGQLTGPSLRAEQLGLELLSGRHCA